MVLKSVAAGSGMLLIVVAAVLWYLAQLGFRGGLADASMELNRRFGTAFLMGGLGLLALGFPLLAVSSDSLRVRLLNRTKVLGAAWGLGVGVSLLCTAMLFELQRQPVENPDDLYMFKRYLVVFAATGAASGLWAQYAINFGEAERWRIIGLFEFAGIMATLAVWFLAFLWLEVRLSYFLTGLIIVAVLTALNLSRNVALDRPGSYRRMARAIGVTHTVAGILAVGGLTASALVSALFIFASFVSSGAAPGMLLQEVYFDVIYSWLGVVAPASTALPLGLALKRLAKYP
jgi:hypothetical protein